MPIQANRWVRRWVLSVARSLTKNVVYTVNYGDQRIKRRGGLGFLRQSSKPVEEEFLAGLELKGKTVYDIGAFMGVLSVFFSKSTGPGGQVISFEPHPDNFRKVLETVELNGAENVRVMNVGISDRDGRARLATRLGRTATSSMEPGIQSQILDEQNTAVLEVPVETLDHCVEVNDLPIPDFVKIDVEGLEYPVLLGMPATLERRPQLFIEVHGADEPRKHENVTKIVQHLNGLHYELLHVESNQQINLDNADQARQGHLFCTKRN